MACVKFLLLALAYMCSNEVKQRCNGYLYYSSTNSSTKGLYKFNISTGSITKLSENCADGLLAVNNKVYFIQTAISYTNDYPIQSNGNGKLCCYDGNRIIEL